MCYTRPDCAFVTIKHPEAIEERVLAHQAELRSEGDSVDGEIARVKQELAKIDQARGFYQRQAAFGRITEQEFDERMDETDELRQEKQSKLDRLLELRDDVAQVHAGLDYATEFLSKLEQRLPEIGQSWEELKVMSEEERAAILKARQEIIRSLVETAYVYADGRVRIEGVLDGSETAQFECRTHCT
jgi:chromosome segregation ATPase